MFCDFQMCDYLCPEDFKKGWVPTAVNKDRCEFLYGEWGKFDGQEESCNLPTQDAGKVCQDNKDCEGDCIARLTPDQEKKVMQGQVLTVNGFCSERMLNLGCLPFVEEGKVKGILCRDRD